MKFISDILYWISTGLLVPVIVLLVFIFIRSLILIGGFFGQYINVRKTNMILQKEFNGLNTDNVEELFLHLPLRNSSLVVSYISRMRDKKDDSEELRRLVSEFEIEADKDLSLSNMLAKMGPMLGLMGTLIPMGPALVGLASGDISSMAYNMQVAFATTVVGLFAAGIGFVTYQVKKRWYMRDMVNLEYLEGKLLRDEGDNDPMSVVGNLFDVAMIFAVALMVALVSRYDMTEIFSNEDYTMVKNPGKENMEIITKKGNKIERYISSENSEKESGRKGRKIGTAYELDNGEIIYVPQ